MLFSISSLPLNHFWNSNTYIEKLFGSSRYFNDHLVGFWFFHLNIEIRLRYISTSWRNLWLFQSEIFFYERMYFFSNNVKIWHLPIWMNKFAQSEKFGMKKCVGPWTSSKTLGSSYLIPSVFLTLCTYAYCGGLNTKAVKFIKWSKMKFLPTDFFFTQIIEQVEEIILIFWSIA